MGREEFFREEVKTIEPSRKTIAQLLHSMADTAYQGRALGEAYKILVDMVRDNNNTIFMGLAGSMSTAGMWKLIRYLVEKRYIDVLVSTGANISEDIYEAMGFKYYKGTPLVDDSLLLKYKIDRFYDVYADELKYREMEKLIKGFIETIKPGTICSTMEFLYSFGKYLDEIGINSILAAAYRSGVPVFSPALVDSGYGIAAVTALRSGHRVVLDMVRDFDQLVEIGNRSSKLSAIYIGGGVPKDYVNLVTVMQTILAEEKGIKDYYKGFEYIIQLTTDAPQWGGLSGATLEEAISWGKVSPCAKKRVVYVDATLGLPLLVHGLIDENVSRDKPVDLSWFFRENPCGVV